LVERSDFEDDQAGHIHGASLGGSVDELLTLNEKLRLLLHSHFMREWV